MSCADPIAQSDDESFAFQLQLEEIEAQRERQTGKWTEDNPPDLRLAFDDFEAELQKAIVLVGDLKFAHSIAKAVDSDAAAIEELKAEETQSVQDRDFALSLDEGGNPPPRDLTASPETSRLGIEAVDWSDVIRYTEASTLSVESDSTMAGPSAPYAQRQKALLEHLPQVKVECSVCGDSIRPLVTVRLACGDIYCRPVPQGLLFASDQGRKPVPTKVSRTPD